MWFKNIHIYQLAEPFTLTAEQLGNLLQQQAARPCSKLERTHYGWTSPLGLESDLLVHAGNGRYLLAARKEEKILPTSVVRERVNLKVVEIERDENRPVGGREKRNLFDSISLSLLPQAFSKAQITYAYIDTLKNWLVVDAANSTRAEDLTVLLRNSLGSLKLGLVKAKMSPSAMFTQWLQHNTLPDEFTLENYCELRDPNSASTVIKCMNQDVTAKEVLGHLDSGKQVIKLGLTWQDRLSFVLDEALNIRRIRFLDLVQQQREDAGAETTAEKFDADFIIFTAEFAEFLPALWDIMGGLEEESTATVAPSTIKHKERVLAEV